MRETIERFVMALADAFDVTTPSVQTDVPIKNHAQYSHVRRQIQYQDDMATIIALTEGGSAAPLRWTLHEFAHHLQQQNNAAYNEEQVRVFTNRLTAELHDDWHSVVVQGRPPSMSIDPSEYTALLLEDAKNV